MKNLTVQVSKLVGTPNNSSWSQIHTFFPEDSDKKNKRGILLAVLAFSEAGEGVETVAFGREILARLHEEYYGETETSTMDKLTAAVDLVHKEFASENQKLEIVAGVILREILYLAIAGKGKVFVKRVDQLQKILSGSGEKVESASGYIKKEDVLVFGTEAFFQILPQGVLRAAVQNDNPEETVETLTPLIWGKENASLAASLVGRVEEQEIIEEEEEVPAVEEKPQKATKNSLKKILDRVSLPKLEGFNKSRAVLSVIGILFLLLLFSLIMGYKNRENQKRIVLYESLYQQILGVVQEGEGLVSLNPDRSKQLLLEAQSKLIELESLKIEASKTESIKKQIEEYLNKVVGEQKLTDVPTLINLELLRENGRGDKLVFQNGILYILDSLGTRVFGFNIKNKSGETIAVNESLGNSSLVTVGDNIIYVYGPSGVVKVDPKLKKAETVIKPDIGWGKIVGISTFMGNLYLVDGGKNNIYRYPNILEGNSFKEAWVKDSNLADLSGVSSVAIDGDVWMLDTKSGKVLKYTGGVIQTFSVKGLNKGFSEKSLIYTTKDLTNLYILDRGNQRLVVIQKTGEYQGQYLWDGFSQISDFVVDEINKKVYLLNGNKILEATLK